MNNDTQTKRYYFITTTVIDWIDIFTRPLYKHVIIESLSFCQKEKGLNIHAWVLMSNHHHLLVSASNEKILCDIVRDFKKYTSKEIIALLQQDVSESRRDWMMEKFQYKAKINQKHKEYQFWQTGFDLQEVSPVMFLDQKINYIHENPVKAEFVDEAIFYRYSSATDYAGGKGLINVELI